MHCSPTCLGRDRGPQRERSLFKEECSGEGPFLLCLRSAPQEQSRLMSLGSVRHEHGNGAEQGAACRQSNCPAMSKAPRVGGGRSAPAGSNCRGAWGRHLRAARAWYGDRHAARHGSLGPVWSSGEVNSQDCTHQRERSSTCTRTCTTGAGQHGLGAIDSRRQRPVIEVEEIVRWSKTHWVNSIKVPRTRSHRGTWALLRTG